MRSDLHKVLDFYFLFFDIYYIFTSIFRFSFLDVNFFRNFNSFPSFRSVVVNFVVP